jgi:hypothetical protein
MQLYKSNTVHRTQIALTPRTRGLEIAFNKFDCYSDNEEEANAQLPYHMC